MADKSDTDLHRRMGLGYDRLAAAAAAVEAGMIPESAADPRDKQIAALVVENSRLLLANGELASQVERLQAENEDLEKDVLNYAEDAGLYDPDLPQDEKAQGQGSAGQSNAFIEPRSDEHAPIIGCPCPKCRN